MAKQLLLIRNLLLIYYDWLTVLKIAIVVFVLIPAGEHSTNITETKLNLFSFSLCYTTT